MDGKPLTISLSTRTEEDATVFYNELAEQVRQGQGILIIPGERMVKVGRLTIKVGVQEDEC